MSSNENQPWNDPRITAYVLDELSPDERTAFEKEMVTDDALAQAVTGAGQVTGQLSALFETETTPPLSEDHRAAIIEKSVIVREEDESTGRKTLIAILAIAATVLALIGLAPILKPQQVAEVDQATVSETTADKEGNGSIPVVSNSAAVELEKQADAFALDRAAYQDVALQSKLETGASLTKMDLSGPVEANSPLAQPTPATEPVVTPATEPSIDQTALGKSRSRLRRSQVMESKSQAEAAPKIQVRPRPSAEYFGMEMEMMDELSMPTDNAPDGQLKSKRQLQNSEDRFQTIFVPESSAWAAKISRDVLAATPRIIIQEEEEFAQTGFDPRSAEGLGPGYAGDRFDRIVENDFIRTADHPLSTFSADVDTASYSKVRDFLMRANQLPRPDAVRIEEMINYFDYADAPPTDDAEHPFAARVNITECPWYEGHRLARIAIKGKTMKPKERPACNLVFLLDTSGSMNASNKLPLVIDGMKMLAGQLTKNDKVAVVVYAGSAGLVLDSTSAKKKKKIRRALENLSAGGSTNGGRGIELAYQTAREHFIEGGGNRVILCTDGDFNVGTTGTDSLVRMVEKEAKDDIYLTVLGFGMGNHNDAMLEQISGRGNGNYAFIDNQREAHKVLVKQTAGTLVTIAKDVKLQVDFNPAKVGAYRLIGYENRILAKEDFNDDKRDAGEVGAGHCVTALYELVPPKLADKLVKPAVDESKYAALAEEKEEEEEEADSAIQPAVISDETLTVRVRYKQPDADTSTRVDFPATDVGPSFDDSSIDTRFTAAVAGFGMLLRGSQHSGDWELADVLKVAKSSLGDDESELRSEFVEMVKKAKRLKGQ